MGDPEKPRLVFFFDEAHLLFDDAPKALLEKIEQVVRLVRSKGVGVYFVTQNPLDVPETVLGQLGNRVQHALRAFTPRDQKAVRAAAETFRPNPSLDAASASSPSSASARRWSRSSTRRACPRPSSGPSCCPPRSPPRSRSRPRSAPRSVSASPLKGHYEQAVDRESAYERLKGRAAQAQPGPAAPVPPEGPGGGSGWSLPRPSPETARVLESVAKSAARAAGTQLGRELIRGVLGSLFGGRRR